MQVMTMLFENDVFDLASLVGEVAHEEPERVAIIEPSGRDGQGRRTYARFTYKTLSEDAESVAVGLRELGIAEKTRTVFMAPPSYEACVVYVALTRVGATVIMIDPAVGLRNVGERLRRLQPTAFVGVGLAHVARLIFGWGPRFLKKSIVVGPGPGFPGARTVASLRRARPERPQLASVGPDDPMTVLYTTGSTGPAKPALYTHRNFCGVLRIAHQSWGFAGREGLPVDMAVFPAFFMIGLSAKGTVVVPPIQFVREPPAKTDPAPLVEVINDCQVRSLFASPIILENMARHAEGNALTMPSLEVIIGGGAPITGPVMGALTRVMPNGEVFANYGATEALPSTAHSARETLAETWEKTECGHGICVGRPFEGVELRVVAIADGSAEEAQDVPPGEIGEVLVKSPHISARYMDDPESTHKNKIGPWHRLGDAGYLDGQGRLWVVGRVGHRVRGEQGPLFPLLCEPIFNAEPRVKRCGLVGVPGLTHDQPVLCVEAHPGADHSELRQTLLQLASDHEVSREIRDVLFIDRLPVDPRHNSKIDRPKLGRWAARRLR
ncbi:AMP-binding protein [Lujinxingia vulgaris]|uniref:AMP-binding protein n=1 Tax=Lujinxingia vulgaris TaxID=2600176 RepID=A0A5C6WWP2_9DELT|nr:fatty acid CoA ligase family protein [Lujinxingia vulgaris]TXD33806.1 AMP-binding protein [Lujinxingia vulgaris]